MHDMIMIKIKIKITPSLRSWYATRMYYNELI